MKKITVSIIVHQDFSHIRTALASLLDASRCTLDIHVTINSGSPEQVAALFADFPHVTVHTNTRPRGFAANHNTILRTAQADYVALLNDDIQAAPAMLDTLLDYMERHKHVGLASPRVLNPDGTPQIMAFNDPSLARMIYKISGLGYLTRHGSVWRRIAQRHFFGRFHRPASMNNYLETQIVPVVVGVAMFVRRAAYQEGGVMDEDTLVYGEEVAWHWRLRQCGWKIVLVADTWVIHFNKDQTLHNRKLTEHRKGMLNYFTRYRPLWQARVLRLAILILHSLRGMAVVLFSREQAIAEWRTALAALTFQPRP